jgi:hypothetical protein
MQILSASSAIPRRSLRPKLFNAEFAGEDRAENTENAPNLGSFFNADSLGELCDSSAFSASKAF